jgi:hypothetical protein
MKEQTLCKLCELPIGKTKGVKDSDARYHEELSHEQHYSCAQQLGKIFQNAGLGPGADTMAMLNGLIELHKAELMDTGPVRDFKAREAKAIAEAEEKFPGWKKMREVAKKNENEIEIKNENEIKDKLDKLTLAELHDILEGIIPPGISEDEIIFVAQGHHSTISRSIMGTCQQWVETYRPEAAEWLGGSG